jgi:hypothetical protein
VSAVRAPDPVALGRGLAEGLRRALVALARYLAFAAVLALPATLIQGAKYASAFLFVLIASAALDVARAALRRVRR